MKNNVLIKFSILSISLFLFSHLAIAPAIPYLHKMYQATDPTIGLDQVETLVSIPGLTITVFVLLSDFVVRVLGKKNTVLLGLVITLIAGVAPYFSTNYKFVLICRLLLGAGIGLYNALSISILSDFYEGKERGEMIGYRTSFLNLGKTITTFIGGYVLAFGANYTFLVYLLVIPVFILFAYNVENTDKTAKVKGKICINKTVVALSVLTFFVGVSYVGSTVKVPSLLVTQYGYSNDFSTSVLTVLAFAGVLSGFTFGKVVNKFGDMTLVFVLAMMSVGSLLFALTNNVVLFFIGALLIGASFVATMSFNFFYISKNVPHASINFATSCVLAIGNVGAILVPVLLTKVLEKAGVEVFITPFYIISVAMAVCTLIVLAVFRMRAKTK